MSASTAARGVSLRGITRRFGPTVAVDDIHLEVAPGELVTLLGPSGCGKTTTLRMVAGLENNDAGTVRIGDEVVSDAASGRFVPPERRQLGMVFQSYAIWPHMTVFENVAYPLRVRGIDRRTVEGQVRRALELVELGPYADRPAPLLSGGQQQRVAIARALSFEPGVLLMDEPLSNLDARLRAQTAREFRLLQRRLGITCLYVTHDQEEAMMLSDRIVLMERGRILQHGTPVDMYRRPASRAVAAFFGAPNLLDVNVLASARADGGWRIRVRGAGWEAEGLADTDMATGSPATAVLRAEDLVVDRPEAPLPDDHVAWTATLAEQTFRGARQSLVARTADVELHAECGFDQAWSVNDRLRVSLPRSRIRIVAR